MLIRTVEAMTQGNRMKGKMKNDYSRNLYRPGL